MIPGKVKLFRVDLKPLRPLRVGKNIITERFILRISLESEGRSRYVDCSPLPGLHTETVEDCVKVAKSYFLGQNPFVPISLATALESLSYTHAPSKTGAWENSDLLSVESPRTSTARVCKVKTGRASYNELCQELDRLLRERPDREFRIDCNQLFDPCTLSELENLIKKYPITYLEEPYSSLNKLKDMARILPIALDENLGRDAELDALAKAWVLKPNLLGWKETLRRFQDPSPVQKVLSNTYESSASLQLYAHAYANAVTNPVALGFGTAFYFPEDHSQWNPQALTGQWPKEPFAQDAFEGELVWES